jgi:hypothetical protein
MKKNGITNNKTRNSQKIWKLHKASNLQNSPYATFTTSMCSIPPRQCCQPPNTGPPFMHVSICSTLQYKLPQKNENNYKELRVFISILANLFPINLNINCYYAIRIIESIIFFFTGSTAPLGPGLCFSVS